MAGKIKTFFEKLGGSQEYQSLLEAIAGNEDEAIDNCIDDITSKVEEFSVGMYQNMFRAVTGYDISVILGNDHKSRLARLAAAPRMNKFQAQAEEIQSAIQRKALKYAPEWYERAYSANQVQQSSLSGTYEGNMSTLF